jgi:hypothetical protein
VEGDIDSLYFAIRLDKNEDINQVFMLIITNKHFYNENFYIWRPSDFYSTNSQILHLKLQLKK